MIFTNGDSHRYIELNNQAISEGNEIFCEKSYKKDLCFKDFFVFIYLFFLIYE